MILEFATRHHIAAGAPTCSAAAPERQRPTAAVASLPPGRHARVQAPAPNTAAAGTDSAAVPSVPSDVAVEVSLPTGLALSLEAEVIADGLYRCNMLATTDVEAILPFETLPAPVRAAYRDAAIIAIQRLNPHAHAAGVRAAAAVVPGFADALPIYLAALKYGAAQVAR